MHPPDLGRLYKNEPNGLLDPENRYPFSFKLEVIRLRNKKNVKSIIFHEAMKGNRSPFFGVYKCKFKKNKNNISNNLNNKSSLHIVYGWKRDLAILNIDIYG